LKQSGYDISESTFANFVEINLKFAGLFVIIFTLFLIIGLFPAIYISLSLKRTYGKLVTPNTVGRRQASGQRREVMRGFEDQ